MKLRNGFTLGQWSVFPLEGRLVGEDGEQRVQPKAMDVLIHLAENAGAVVERDHLLRQVWGERAQSDEPLTRCIGDLRRALGDTRSEPEYILTIPKRGYQLLTTVAPLASDDAEEESSGSGEADATQLTEPQGKARRELVKRVGIVILVLSAVALIGVLIERSPGAPGAGLGDVESPGIQAGTSLAPDSLSIAVLPFVNMSADSDQEYFSDGISEELINLLAQIPDLRVISRSSAFSFKGKRLDIATIAEQLDVNHVLEGSVRKSGDRVRVTAKLINVESDAHLFSESYDRTLNDIFKIQDEIAASVVDRLRLVLLDRRLQTSPVDPQAYDEYLRGRYLAELGNASSMQEAQVRFENAVRIETYFAGAWVALGDIYRFRASRGQMDQEEGLQQARAAAARALAIDPEHPGAYVLRGRIARNFDWNWQSADADLQKAASLDPGNPQALLGAAGLAQTLGRLDEAVQLAQEAVLVDPVSLTGLQNLALFQLYAGRLGAAEATVRNLIERDATIPTAYAMLSWIHVLSGNAEAAVDAAHRESEEPVRIFSEAIAYSAIGDPDAAEDSLNALINNYGDIWYYQIALICAYRGLPDEAFAWLDKAFAARDTGMSVMLTEPFLEKLHNDPRWQEMLSRMNLPTH